MDKSVVISQTERICLIALLYSSLKNLDDNKSLSRFRFDSVNELKVNYKSVLSKLQETFNG